MADDPQAVGTETEAGLPPLTCRRQSQRQRSPPPKGRNWPVIRNRLHMIAKAVTRLRPRS
jgi:hypothetical protein